MDYACHEIHGVMGFKESDRIQDKDRLDVPHEREVVYIRLIQAVMDRGVVLAQFVEYSKLLTAFQILLDEALNHVCGTKLWFADHIRFKTIV